MADLGPIVENWQAPPAPGAEIAGRYVTLERLRPDHAPGLFAANGADTAMWDYMGYGPFADPAAYSAWLEGMAGQSDPCFYAIRERATGALAGVASFLRIDRANGVIEIGHIAIAPPAQRTRVSSEAIMAMIGWAFDAGYRRVEWKCNALNAASQRAARRYGFTHEGTFRQHMISKGRNRDTAWFAMTDGDWPAISARFAAWLVPANFDAAGRQKATLQIV